MKLKKSTIYMMANPIAYGVRIIPVTGWVLDEHPELAIVRQLPNKDGLINTDFWDLACRDSGRVLKRGRRGESKQHLADNSKKEIEAYYKQRASGKYNTLFEEHKKAMEENGYTVRNNVTDKGRIRPMQTISERHYTQHVAQAFLNEMRRLGYADTFFELKEVGKDSIEIWTCARTKEAALMGVLVDYIYTCVEEMEVQ